MDESRRRIFRCVGGHHGAPRKEAMIRTISREELAQLLGTPNVTVGEVLPLAHYRAGHLPGAIHLPLEGLERSAATLSPRATLVLYCAGPTCRNSDQAAERLMRGGHDDVRVFRGGKQEWRDAGLALEVEQ
jgi:rhodanese-related sulfurtransferase